MKKRHDTDTAISDIGGIIVPRDPAVYRVDNVAHEVEDGQGLTGCGKPSVYFLGLSESGDTSSVRLARCFGAFSQPVKPWASNNTFNNLVPGAYER